MLFIYIKVKMKETTKKQEDIMKFSDRILDMQYSPIRKLVPYADEAMKNGVKVYQLHIGQPDVQTPDSFFEGLQNYKEKIIKYANSRGVFELLDTFSKSYHKMGIDLDVEDLLITHGGSEALMFTLSTICNPGDEVLVPEPYYSNYESFLKAADAKLVPIETKLENNYHLPTKEEIEKLITPKTKAIMFSNPSNPTGTVFTFKEMDMIVEIAEKYDLFIVTDEVYRQFIYDDIEYKSFLTIKGVEDRVILIDSISKHYSACGARIGVIGSKNKEFISLALKLCQARLAVSTIEQYASANLINTIDTYIDEVKLEYKVRRDLLYNHLKEIEGVVCFKPSSSFYILAELPVDNIEKFVMWLLTEFRYENQTLMFAPGPGFYSGTEKGIKEARFSFCTNNLTEIENGMKVLKQALKVYNNK